MAEMKEDDKHYTVSIYGWQYRVRQDGLVESTYNPQKRELLWEVRHATATGISDNRYAAIRDSLRQNTGQFPKEFEPLPTSKQEPPSVPKAGEPA